MKMRTIIGWCLSHEQSPIMMMTSQSIHRGFVHITCQTNKENLMSDWGSNTGHSNLISR